jgi:PAS domain S-box-containing protein
MNQPDELDQDRALSDKAESGDSRQPSLEDPQPQFAHFTQHFLGLAWIKNRHGRYVYVNDAARQVFGAIWSDVVGKTDDDLFPASVAAQFRANDQKVIAGKIALETVEELEQADGLHRSLVSKFPIFGQDGEVLLVGGMAIDITNQLRLQDELHHSQAQLQLIADHTPLAIAYCDAEQCYRFINKVYAEQLGMPTTAILGKHVSDILGTEAYGRIAPYIGRVLSGHTVEFHLALPFKTIGERFVQVVYVPDRGVDAARGWIALVTDVTERHRFEVALRDSEERYRQLAQHLPAALYATDAHGRIRLYNSAAVALWGRTPDPDRDRWCGSYRIYRPDGKVLPWEECPMAVAVKEGRSIQAEEMVIARPDGTRRHVLAYPYPTNDAAGSVVGAVNMLVDITERKLAETLIQEQAALLEQTHDAIFVWNLGGGITYWNHGAERLYGFTAQEALGRMSHELLKTFHPAGLGPIEEAVKRDGQWMGELVHMTRDGARVTVESRLLLSRRAEGQLLVLESNRDITTRKQAERALRDSEERLRLATQTGKLGIWDWDITTNRITWSDSLYGIHGVRRDQFDGRLEGFESLIHPDDRARVAEAIQATLREGVPYELEFRALRPDGGVIWLFTNAAVFHEDERPRRMVGATFDITDRKQTEAALRQSESLYRTLLEQAHDGIYVCDSTGRIVMANEVACRLFGYSRDELLGLSIRDTYEADKRHLFDQRFAEVQQGKALRFERKAIRKDGSSFDAELSVTMLDQRRGHATIRDVTRRKEAEVFAAKRTERMRLLSETLAQLLSARDPETIVRELFPKVAAHLGVDTYFNFMVDETGQALRLHSCAGVSDEIVDSIRRLEFGQAICGTVAQIRAPIIANDIQHSGYDKAELVRTFGIQTYACHPLMAGGRLLGTLSFASRTRPSFDEDEIEFIRIISQYTAVALDRLRTTKALAEHTRSLEIVNRVGTTLAAELDLNKLVQAVTDAGREVSGAEVGAFFYNVENDEGESYQLFALSGASPEAFAGFGMPRNTPVFGPTFRGEAPIRVPDIMADPRYGTMAPHHGMPEGHLPVRSYLAVPVVSRSGEVFGGLFFGHSRPGIFTEEAEKTLVGIAAQAAVAIDNANLYQAVQKELAEHKRIQEALRASEEKFRAMADHIAQFAWMTDAQGWIFWYNRRWFEYTGTTLEDMQGWGWQKVHHPDHVERVTARFRRALETGEFWEDTFPLRGRDGEYRWFLSRAVPIRDEAGRVLRWFGTNTDITAQREAELALRRSEALYRAIGESIDYGIWVCDAEGRNTYASESFLKLVGVTQEQCAEFGWGEVLHPDDAERTITAWRECVRAGEVWDCEHRFLGVDGRYHPILARGVPVHDDGGRVVGWAGINLDISGLRQAQDNLREKTERLLVALNASHTGTFRWNLRSDELTWDDALDQLFGVASGQTARSLDQFLRLVHQDDRDAVLHACERCREAVVDFEAEFRVTLPDGTLRWIYGRGKPITLGEGGLPEFMTGACVDVTERRQAEERLRQWTADLEERVRERTEQLTRSQERLRALATEVTLTEQRERRRIASELHDYLAQLLVLGRLKLTQGRKQANVAEDQWMKELDQLLDQSLTYTRSLVAQLSPPVLHEFGLIKALHWLGETMRQHGLRVEVQSNDPFLALPDDQAILLYQSIRELLLNVVKHAQSERATITLRVTPDDALHILVADQGRGFDPNAASSGDPKSSRYGLFSIRERMTVMGGALTVESALGQGTSVTIAIPYRREATASNPPSSSAVRPAAGARAASGTGQGKEGVVRVLLADDHAMVRQGLRSILDSYADITIVGEAANGVEAVNLAGALKPHVVVMDLNMPLMDGIEATRRIKRSAPSIVVIGLSVRNDREAEEAMRHAGASGYLTKESAAEQLHQAICELLQRTLPPVH